MNQISENDVYVKGEKHRRVVGILGDKVCYSIGSDRNRFCKLKTFSRWARRARLEHRGDKEKSA